MLALSKSSLWRPALSLILLILIAKTQASALTTTIAANERSCFYSNVDKEGEKVRNPFAAVSVNWDLLQVGFYFAVSQAEENLRNT